jgi:hypothetical protein
LHFFISKFYLHYKAFLKTVKPAYSSHNSELSTALFDYFFDGIVFCVEFRIVFPKIITLVSSPCALIAGAAHPLGVVGFFLAAGHAFVFDEESPLGILFSVSISHVAIVYHPQDLSRGLKEGLIL